MDFYSLSIRDIDFRNTDSLGFQLVNILAEQIRWLYELKRDNGTEFTIMV